MEFLTETIFSSRFFNPYTFSFRCGKNLGKRSRNYRSGNSAGALTNKNTKQRNLFLNNIAEKKVRKNKTKHLILTAFMAHLHLAKVVSNIGLISLKFERSEPRFMLYRVFH